MRPRQMMQLTLGELEREVMEEVWRRGRASVRELHEFFGERAAYTTVMTTLDRLYKKRLLDRRKTGRAFIYTPRVSREEFEHGVAKDLIDGLLGRNAEPVLACIVEAISERNDSLLDELDRLVKLKRSELKRKE
ncbi:MAG: BlaI/MecI/CopY family transcriptional regulator [Blastocatellia bacterium]|nr:BlaI/MecI/CopY family transcriptional regulator [Blastocatellia bacterium]